MIHLSHFLREAEVVSEAKMTFLPLHIIFLLSEFLDNKLWV